MAIYKRKGSKVWQIEIKHGPHCIRKSSGTKTGATLRSSPGARKKSYTVNSSWGVQSI